MNRILVISIAFFFVCCEKNTEAKGDEIIVDIRLECGPFYRLGEQIDTTYTFCSIVPVEQNYSYRKGKWEFWLQEGEYLGEIEFGHALETIEGHGGCPYEIMVSSIISTSKKLDIDIMEQIERYKCKPKRTIITK